MLIYRLFAIKIENVLLQVLVIGGGPCGLRFAMEALLLGSEVHVIEKRDYISRNNILHLWEFVKTDLINFGIKSVYPQFCIGNLHNICEHSSLKLIFFNVTTFSFRQDNYMHCWYPK